MNALDQGDNSLLLQELERLRKENDDLKDEVKQLKDDLAIPCTHCDYYQESIRSTIANL